MTDAAPTPSPARPRALSVNPEVVLYAVRYCLGRTSYAAGDGARLVRLHATALPEDLREALVRDLRGHLSGPAHREPADIRDGWALALAALLSARPSVAND